MLQIVALLTCTAQIEHCACIVWLGKGAHHHPAAGAGSLSGCGSATDLPMTSTSREASGSSGHSVGSCPPRAAPLPLQPIRARSRCYRPRLQAVWLLPFRQQEAMHQCMDEAAPVRNTDCWQGGGRSAEAALLTCPVANKSMGPFQQAHHYWQSSLCQPKSAACLPRGC